MTCQEKIQISPEAVQFMRKIPVKGATSCIPGDNTPMTTPEGMRQYMALLAPEYADPYTAGLIESIVYYANLIGVSPDIFGHTVNLGEMGTATGCHLFNLYQVKDQDKRNQLRGLMRLLWDEFF